MELSQSARPYLMQAGIIRTTRCPLPSVNSATFDNLAITVPTNAQVLNPTATLDPDQLFAVAPEFLDV
jgi:hypothetical protein